VSLTPKEAEIVRKWIADNATAGPHESSGGHLVAEDVEKHSLKHIYCLGVRPNTFGRIDIVNEATGDVLLTDWSRTEQTGWLHWEIQPNKLWPERVTIRLTVGPVDELAPSEPAGTVFIISSALIDKAMLDKFESAVSFEKNPFSLATEKFGMFTYQVETASDLTLRIKSSRSGTTAFEKNEFNLRAGKNAVRWDFGPQPLEKGDYSARFRFRAHDARAFQPDYVILLRAM